MERIASVSCFLFFFFFPPFLPLDVCCLFCVTECEQMQKKKRRTRVRQGARNEPFPWWAMLGAGAPAVRVATAAAPYGALPAHQARPHAHRTPRWCLIPGTAWEVGVAHADFTSHEAGAQRGRAEPCSHSPY